MRKKSNTIFLFLITVLLTPIFVIGAQDLGDVEIVTQKVEEVYMTRYGYVVSYSTSDIYRDYLFLPKEWFTKEKDNINISANQKVTYLNIDVPLLKITYVDAELKYITLFIPKGYSQRVFPMYQDLRYDKHLRDDEHPLDDEKLKEKFLEQLSRNTLTIK